MGRMFLGSGATICTLLPVAVWRTQIAYSPASTVTYATHLPSGEIEAEYTLPSVVNCVIVMFASENSCLCPKKR